MSHPRKKGILFIGPGEMSQGGIAAVINNYAKTEFWTRYNCSRFSSTKDHRLKFIAPLADFFKLCSFATTLWYPNRPTAVSIHTSHSGSFYRKLPYIVVARIFHVPVVLHIHPAAFSDFYNRGNKARRAAIRFAGRLSDQIVCLSKETREELSDIFDADKLRIRGNPVDVSLFKRQTGSTRAKRPQVLFLGWIVKAKGVYDLLEAIPIVLKRFPNALFIFAGNKEIEKLSGQISQRCLEDSARVLGWVAGQQKLDLIHSSWLLVLPSYTEGLPNVILEAMAGKLPIVTTPVGGIPSVLTHGESAMFVEPGDVDAIADAILTLLEDQEQSAEIASAAFEQVSKQYSLEAIGHGLKEIYYRY